MGEATSEWRCCAFLVLLDEGGGLTRTGKPAGPTPGSGELAVLSSPISVSTPTCLVVLGAGMATRIPWSFGLPHVCVQAGHLQADLRVKC